MTILVIIATIITSYLLGSIPTAVWYGKSQHDLDVREHGSGNAGATNTFRVLGKKAGTIVITIDILKGYLASSLPLLLVNFQVNIDPPQTVVLQLTCGIFAVVGHIFPLYANFKGGKGVATLLGMILALNIWAALGCIAVFLIVFFISKYVSLGSMTAGITFPILLLFPEFYQHSPSKVLVIFGFILATLLIITHRKNIKRLIDGEENKANISFGKKTK